MSDDLRTRIAAAIYDASDEYARKLMVRPDCPGASEVEGDNKPVCYILADAVIRELTAAIPPIVATAIQGYAQSELAGMSYHGASKDAFEVMEKMNREALQIAKYATTHEDWNG